MLLAVYLSLEAVVLKQWFCSMFVARINRFKKSQNTLEDSIRMLIEHPPSVCELSNLQSNSSEDTLGHAVFHM